MKIEQLLVQHFYNARQVTLQGVGTFTLSPDFVLPLDEKDLVMPENAITFEFDLRSTEDDALINYIVQQTRKIKPLAAADLDSYLVLGKQFLNIGKPFRIEGLGMLEKKQQGQYEFVQGNFSSAKKENTPPAANLKEKHEPNDISFAAPAKGSAIPKKGIIAAASLIGLIMIAAAVWYLFLRDKKGNSQSNIQPAENSIVTKPVASTDTSNKQTAIQQQPVTNNDGYTFKIVFKVTNNKALALERLNTLTTRGHNIIMYTKDSVTYTLAEPFKLPLSDTTRVKDSLNNYFYLGKAYVEVN